MLRKQKVDSKILPNSFFLINVACNKKHNRVWILIQLMTEIVIKEWNSTQLFKYTLRTFKRNLEEMLITNCNEKSAN